VPTDAVTFLEDSNKWMTEMKKNRPLEIPTVLAKIKELVDLKKVADFQHCMQVARDLFETDFDHNIRNLLRLFPADHKDSSGNPFWSGPKRCPNPLTFNADEPLTFNFVSNTANLIAFNLNIKQIRDENELRACAHATRPNEYVATVITVDLDEGKKKEGEAAEKKEEPKELSLGDDEVISNLMSKLTLDAKNYQGEGHVIPADFEKDDDDNCHIAFINAAANCRASNYRIAESDMHKTKMIAGKIIPAIATTTAMITGAVLVEVFKYVQKFDNLEQYKNSFINLAIPMILFSEPDPIKTNKSGMDPIQYMEVVAIPEGWTKYDRTVVDKGSLTLKQFFEYMKAEHGFSFDGISVNPILLYNCVDKKHQTEERMNTKMEDLF